MILELNGVATSINAGVFPPGLSISGRSEIVLFFITFLSHLWGRPIVKEAGLLPGVVLLAFSFRIQYFKWKSLILAGK